MANILEELWRGNVVPHGSVRHTPEMTQLMGYISRHHEKLTSNLTGELKETLRKAFEERTPINDALHEKLMQIFRMYLIVGGMPAAVKKFRESKDLEEVVAEHEDIVTQYKKDFTKYCAKKAI